MYSKQNLGLSTFSVLLLVFLGGSQVLDFDVVLNLFISICFKNVR